MFLLWALRRRPRLLGYSSTLHAGLWGGSCVVLLGSSIDCLHGDLRRKESVAFVRALRGLGARKRTQLRRRARRRHVCCMVAKRERCNGYKMNESRCGHPDFLRHQGLQATKQRLEAKIRATSPINPIRPENHVQFPAQFCFIDIIIIYLPNGVHRTYSSMIGNGNERLRIIINIL